MKDDADAFEKLAKILLASGAEPINLVDTFEKYFNSEIIRLFVGLGFFDDDENSDAKILKEKNGDIKIFFHPKIHSLLRHGKKTSPTKELKFRKEHISISFPVKNGIREVKLLLLSHLVTLFRVKGEGIKIVKAKLKILSAADKLLCQLIPDDVNHTITNCFLNKKSKEYCIMIKIGIGSFPKEIVVKYDTWKEATEAAELITSEFPNRKIVFKSFKDNISMIVKLPLCIRVASSMSQEVTKELKRKLENIAFIFQGNSR